MQAYMDSVAAAEQQTSAKEYVSATFKTMKVVNAQTTETARKHTLDFRITHRFGSMGVESNGGGHTLWGFDDSRDIRFAFDYGITEKLQVGIGRSKMRELLDANIKWRFLTQTIDNSIPVSIALYTAGGFTPIRKTELYAGLNPSLYTEKTAHRFNYVSQLVIARKFSNRFSMVVLPTYMHRNFVIAEINPENEASDSNDLLAAGLAFRFKLTQRFSIVADYFYIFSDFRRGGSGDVSGYYDPLGIGVEFETGGHVFHIDLTNAAGILENNFIPFTQDGWQNGGYKLGFSITRSFAIGKKKG